MMEILIPVVIALITSVLGPVLLEWSKNKFRKKQSDPMPDAIRYNEQIEHESTFSTWNCLPKNLRERKCDGCYLLDQGLGGENQQGHLCLESSDDYEFM